MKLVIRSFLLSLFIGFYSVASHAAFQVNTAVDGHDKDLTDGRCLTNEGQCSLRAAVEQTNAEALQASGVEIIRKTISLPFDHYILTLGELSIDLKGRTQLL